MLIGYARVSTNEQNLDLQLDALTKAGCERIFQEHLSGSKSDRPELQQAFDFLREGDTLVCWRLDRIGRSLKHLIQISEDLKAKNIGLKSLTEGLDTTTSGGKLIFHIFGALAEFERDVIRERTLAGLASARARGRMGGRPGAPQSKIDAARILADTTNKTIKEICETVGISRRTYYARTKDTGKA